MTVDKLSRSTRTRRVAVVLTFRSAGVVGMLKGAQLPGLCDLCCGHCRAGARIRDTVGPGFNPLNATASQSRSCSGRNFQVRMLQRPAVGRRAGSLTVAGLRDLWRRRRGTSCQPAGEPRLGRSPPRRGRAHWGDAGRSVPQLQQRGLETVEGPALRVQLRCGRRTDTGGPAARTGTCWWRTGAGFATGMIDADTPGPPTHADRLRIVTFGPGITVRREPEGWSKMAGLGPRRRTITEHRTDQRRPA
jgi:hypothetical protein